MRRTRLDDPELSLSRLFALRPAAAVFLERRMACLGGPIAPFHTVDDACREYRLDPAEFRARLRNATRSAARC